MALLYAFFINLAVVAANSARFFSLPCATARAGPLACLAPRAWDVAGNLDLPQDGGVGQSCSLPDGTSGGRCGQIGLTSEG